MTQRSSSPAFCVRLLSYVLDTSTVLLKNDMPLQEWLLFLIPPPTTTRDLLVVIVE